MAMNNSTYWIRQEYDFLNSDEENFEVTEIFILIIVIILAILILGSNSLTIFAVIKHKILWKTTNILIISLSISDLLVGIHLVVCSSIQAAFLSSKNVCLYCLNTVATNILISMLTACAIAAERYTAIVHPFFYEAKMSAKKMLWCAVFIWIYSIIFTNINWMSNKCADGELFNFSYTHGPNVMHNLLFTVGFMVHCGVVLVLCSYLYYKIYRVAVDHLERIHGLVSRHKPFKKVNKECELHVLIFNKRSNSSETKVDSLRDLPQQSADESDIQKLENYVGFAQFGKNVCGELDDPSKMTKLKKIDEERDTMNVVDHGETENVPKRVKQAKKGKKEKDIDRNQGYDKCLECRKHKIARMTFLVLVAMFACFVPHMCIMIPGVIHGNIVLEVIHKLFLYLIFVNSFLNPLLYSYQMKDFRKAYKDLLSL